MSLLLMALIGAAAGYLAARVMGLSVDPFTAVGVGVVGGMLGVMGLRLVLSVVHGAALMTAAVVGAVALLWLWRAVVERR